MNQRTGRRTPWKRPKPIVVVHLFPEILDALLELLSSLTPEQWDRPIASSIWSVKDTSLHLLADDIGILSRKRDRFSLGGPPIKDWDDLVSLIDQLNAAWLEATRRISPRLLHNLLRFAGTQVHEYLQSLDPYAIGDPVSWAGPEPAPVWLDLAREYTERWHHQQHIRDAVLVPGLKQPRYLAPVLDTFARALPHTYREVGAKDGTAVALNILGASGGRWFLVRERDSWNLYLDSPPSLHAEVTLHEEVAWRLFTRGIRPDEARPQATIAGDQPLGSVVLDMVSIIA
jgi:hypothetical protein